MIINHPQYRDLLWVYHISCHILLIQVKLSQGQNMLAKYHQIYHPRFHVCSEKPSVWVHVLKGITTSREIMAQRLTRPIRYIVIIKSDQIVVLKEVMLYHHTFKYARCKYAHISY